HGPSSVKQNAAQRQMGRISPRNVPGAEIASEEEQIGNATMTLSQMRCGFPRMNRSPRPMTRPTQKSWLAIIVTKRVEKNTKAKGPSRQLGMSTKAQKTTHEKMITLTPL